MGYLENVIAAIRADRDHRGSSRQAIAKYLKATHGQDNKTALRKALKAGVTKGKLVQEGARFRVAGDKPVTPPDDGFRSRDITEGDGTEAAAGDSVTVSYKGKLEDGTVFDSAKSFTFLLGAGEVIKGWDRGVAGMKVGGKRKLKLPPAFAYGARGSPPDIPPDATLKFTVKLLKVDSA